MERLATRRRCKDSGLWFMVYGVWCMVGAFLMIFNAMQAMSRTLPAVYGLPRSLSSLSRGARLAPLAYFASRRPRRSVRASASLPCPSLGRAPLGARPRCRALFRSAGSACSLSRRLCPRSLRPLADACVRLPLERPIYAACAPSGLLPRSGLGRLCLACSAVGVWLLRSRVPFGSPARPGFRYVRSLVGHKPRATVRDMACIALKIIKKAPTIHHTP